jgi:hypothetical protein
MLLKIPATRTPKGALKFVALIIKILSCNKIFFFMVYDQNYHNCVNWLDEEGIILEQQTLCFVFEACVATKTKQCLLCPQLTGLETFYYFLIKLPPTILDSSRLFYYIVCITYMIFKSSINNNKQTF